MRSLVVLPSYNEAENVLPLSADVLSRGASIEVLVVDDNSPDGTGELVAKAALEDPRLHLLTRPAKLGIGSAYLAGFRWALDRDFDRILTMDCDYSHHPRYLPDVLAAMKDADTVVGSRYVPGGGVSNWSLRRRALSRFANTYTRILLRVSVHDCTAGFRCYSREVLEHVDPFSIKASGYSFLEEMVWRIDRSGFRIVETPIVFEDRHRGVSKIDQREIFRAALHVLATAFRRAPVTRVRRD